MTTLPPRRRPLFNRRGHLHGLVKTGGIAVVFLLVASVSFAAGIKVGAMGLDGGSLQALVAAEMH